VAQKRNSLRAILLAFGIIWLMVGAIIYVQGRRADSQMVELQAHGVPVAYRVAQCSQKDVGDSDNPSGPGGLTCTGQFTYRGHTYGEDLLGVPTQDNVYNNTSLAALVNPARPGAYVYLRSAVEGYSARHQDARIGQGLFLLIISVLLIGLAAALPSLRRSRLGQAFRSYGEQAAARRQRIRS
jgi:hypothetical protein